MSKIFLYIDESKDLASGIIILGGFTSFHGKSSCNSKIELCTSKLCPGVIGELKSTTNAGKAFVVQNGIQNLYSTGMINAIVATCKLLYFRDSYEGYRDALIQLLNEMKIDMISGSEIEIFIDNIPLLKNSKLLQQNLLRDIRQAGYNKVIGVHTEKSENQPCIQIADLIVGEIKKYYRFREYGDINTILPDIPKQITKKIS